MLCLKAAKASASEHGAAESGVNCGVIGVVAIASAFVSIAPELAGAVLGLRGACLAGCVVTMGQSTILSRAKAGHECREGCHTWQIETYQSVRVLFEKIIYKKKKEG